MPSNVNEQKKKSNLIEIRDILKNELNKFSNISSTLKDTSDGLNNIDTKYNDYNKEIDESKSHIIKLKKREFFENLFIYIALAFYIICIIYITLKRFPIHRIIFFIYNILEYISNIFFSFTIKIADSLNSNKLVNSNLNGFNNSEIIQNLTESFQNFVYKTYNYTGLNNETLEIIHTIGNNKTEF